MKLLFWPILICIVFIGGIWTGIEYQKTRIPHIRDFQRLIGAKADGKVGPGWQTSETQACWKAAYMKQNGTLMY